MLEAMRGAACSNRSAALAPAAAAAVERRLRPAGGSGVADYGASMLLWQHEQAQQLHQRAGRGTAEAPAPVGGVGAEAAPRMAAVAWPALPPGCPLFARKVSTSNHSIDAWEALLSPVMRQA